MALSCTYIYFIPKHVCLQSAAGGASCKKIRKVAIPSIRECKRDRLVAIPSMSEIGRPPYLV